VNGQVVGEGNKGQVVTIGPFIRYHQSPDWGAILKWQAETAVENQAQGNRFILQFTFGLW
jgi:Protein involved in meta-pathway of phenol degradation